MPERSDLSVFLARSLGSTRIHSESAANVGFQPVWRRGPAIGREDPLVRPQQHRRGKDVDPVAPRDVLVILHGREGDVVAPQERLHRRHRVRLLVHPQHHQALVPVALVQRLEVRQRSDAGGTPRRPEVEQDDLPLERAQFDPFPIQCFSRELRCGLTRPRTGWTGRDRDQSLQDEAEGQGHRHGQAQSGPEVFVSAVFGVHGSGLRLGRPRAYDRGAWTFQSSDE